MERSRRNRENTGLGQDRRGFFFSVSEALCTSLLERLNQRFSEFFGQPKPGGAVIEVQVKPYVVAIQDLEAAWVRLRIEVASSGIAYQEVNRLDIFEFFNILREVRRQNNRKND